MAQWGNEYYTTSDKKNNNYRALNNLKTLINKIFTITLKYIKL